MALEIPNAIHAAGFFAPNPTPPVTPSPICSSVGFQAINPATDPAAPLGGFTRVSLGVYVMRTVDPIATLEGVVAVTIYNPGSARAVRSAGILPSLIPFNADSNCVGADFVDFAAAPQDCDAYQIIVFRVTTLPG